MTKSNAKLHWNAGGHEEELEVLAARGREEVGELFEYVCIAKRSAGPLPDTSSTGPSLDALLASPCALTFHEHAGAALHAQTTYGLLSSVERMDAGPTATHAYYRITIVPRLALLGLGRASRVFPGGASGELRVTDLLRVILPTYGLAEGTDFIVNIAASALPAVPYALQLEESDLAFLDRWMRCHGVFYSFEHVDDPSGGRDRVVFNLRDPSAASIVSLAYEGQSDGLSTTHLEFVTELHRTVRRTPARVARLDFEAAGPTGRVCVAETGDDAAPRFGRFGMVLLGAERPVAGNVATSMITPASEAITSLRAARFGTERVEISARTPSLPVRAGSIVDVEGAYGVPGSERLFVTRSVVSFGCSPDAQLAEVIASAAHPDRRWARISAVPLSTGFVPQLAAWPRVVGVVRGYVEDTSASTATFPNLDGAGGYTVRLPMLASATQAIPNVRMAEPFSGANGAGMHFPLRRGAEVLVAFVGGDPDQPVIVGAVPNTSTPSPVHQSNHNKSILELASGVRMVVTES
ncbi:MAG: contractile injection system protein, VgrG/Pvc8 family [Polyangiaceae bacterium]